MTRMTGQEQQEGGWTRAILQPGEKVTSELEIAVQVRLRCQAMLTYHQDRSESDEIISLLQWILGDDSARDRQTLKREQEHEREAARVQVKEDKKQKKAKYLQHAREVLVADSEAFEHSAQKST